MTREEAIETIKYILKVIPKEPPTECDNIEEWLCEDDEIRKALEMAIKALEKKPCNDAISKSDVFETLGNLMSIPYDFDRPINEKDVSESMDEIRALPPVTPARPKGHWINIDKTHSKCDKCESIFEIVSVNGEANYCPNCGCFMSEGGKGRKDKMSEEELERIKKWELCTY